MHAGRRYSFQEILVWTRREALLFILVAAIPTALYALAGWKWVAMPWLPIAMIGTAVAFITGFKNNASYSRLWEARQIWGSIVNQSRTWGFLVLDMIPEEESRRRLIHRHIAWLTALRYQLRERRNWENMDLSYNIEYQRKYNVPEWAGNLEAELAQLVPASELQPLLQRKNRALHLLAIQSKEPRALIASGAEGELRILELQRVLAALVDAQGRCERIKNFPYPRQYATLNHIFVWILILATPLGLLQEFLKFGGGFIWLNVPVSAGVAWIFHTMDKIGEGTENPFEGGPNDVPITSLSRTIEIDLREMLGEASLPPAIPVVNQILM